MRQLLDIGWESDMLIGNGNIAFGIHRGVVDTDRVLFFASGVSD